MKRIAIFLCQGFGSVLHISIKYFTRFDWELHHAKNKLALARAWPARRRSWQNIDAWLLIGPDLSVVHLPVNTRERSKQNSTSYTSQGQPSKTGTFYHTFSSPSGPCTTCNNPFHSSPWWSDGAASGVRWLGLYLYGRAPSRWRRRFHGRRHRIVVRVARYLAHLSAISGPPWPKFVRSQRRLGKGPRPESGEWGRSECLGHGSSYPAVEATAHDRLSKVCWRRRRRLVLAHGAPADSLRGRCVARVGVWGLGRVRGQSSSWYFWAGATHTRRHVFPPEYALASAMKLAMAESEG